jgi:hypothetical protein
VARPDDQPHTRLHEHCNFSSGEELLLHKAVLFLNCCLALPVDRDYRGCLTTRSRIEHPNCISFAKNRPSIKHLSGIGEKERGIGMINGQTSKSASARSPEHLQPSSTTVPFTPINWSSSLMQSPASRRIAILSLDWIGTRGKNQASKRRTI